MNFSFTSKYTWTKKVVWATRVAFSMLKVKHPPLEEIEEYAGYYKGWSLKTGFILRQILLYEKYFKCFSLKPKNTSTWDPYLTVC